MNNLEFGRGKDKKKRKSRGLGFGSRFNSKRDSLAEKLGNSALSSGIKRARRGKYNQGLADQAKSFLSNKIASDKKGVEKKLRKTGQNLVESEYKTASRQAKQLNRGRSLEKGDQAAAGLFYDRTKGKYISARMRTK